MFDIDERPRPLKAIGFQLETTTSFGSGETSGRIIFEQEGRGRVRCSVRGEDVAYLEDIGRQVMAGSRIRKLEAEHAALRDFVQELFPGMKIVEQEVHGEPTFSLQLRRP